MSDIFISYAHTTSPQARGAALALRSLGYSVWLDDDLPAHRAFSPEIEAQLAAAKAALVIWSAEAAQSEWVLSEANRAREDHKLVQLRIDGARLPMPFDQIQCADLSGWSGEGEHPAWSKVTASVANLVRGVGGAGAARQSVPAAAAGAEPLLAVLAFDNLSGDPEMAYFSDGVSEEILQTVARGAELKVIGRGSSFQFRGADKAAGRVGAALRATHVLDGSVRRSGAKVRVAANLIECASETTLWSDRFDRELSDVFALQDEIASAVADALKVAFSPKSRAETIDPGAYSLYLKALEIRNRGLETDSRRTVIGLLDEAVERAPQFARAWVFLAKMLAMRIRLDDPEVDRAELRVKAIAAAQTTLTIDPSLGGAFQALAVLEPLAHFAQRELYHQRALALAGDDPTVLTDASLFYAEVGALSRAAELAARAYELDPLYPWAANWYAGALEMAGRFPQARDLYDTCRRLWPENDLLATCALCFAANTEQWDWYDQVMQDVQARGFSGPTYRHMVTFTQAVKACDGDEQLAAAQRAFAKRGEVAARTIVELHQLGFAEAAFDLVERASFDYMASPEGRAPDAALSPVIMFAPHVAPGFMEDRRFVRLCAKLGLCDYWIETGHWPDCAAEGALPYDFKAECRRLAASRSGRPQAPGGR